MDLLKGTVRFVLVITTIGATLAFALVLGRALGNQQSQAAQANPRQVTSPASLTNATSTFIAYENAILGYGISLPDTYRRAGSSTVAGPSELLGTDTYTLLTEAEQRANCLQDLGDMPSGALAALVSVEAHRNVAGISAVAWATTSAIKTPRATVVSAKIGGLEAARVVEDGVTSGYVIRANDRVYVIAASIRPSQHPLDGIAKSFIAIAPQALPTPTPTTPSNDAERAQILGRDLTAAFASRDVDAIARLLTPNCWLVVSSVIESTTQAPVRGGVLNRSVAAFVEGLRTAFASHDLKVIVDADLQTQAQGNGASRFFVRSQWIASGRSTPIDLFLGPVDGQWHLVEALHHYQRQDLIRGCIPYQTPWVSASGSC